MEKEFDRPIVSFWSGWWTYVACTSQPEVHIWDKLHESKHRWMTNGSTNPHLQVKTWENTSIIIGMKAQFGKWPQLHPGPWKHKYHTTTTPGLLRRDDTVWTAAIGSAFSICSVTQELKKFQPLRLHHCHSHQMPWHKFFPENLMAASRSAARTIKKTRYAPLTG